MAGIGGKARYREPLGILSPRQQEIVRLRVQGLSCRQIGEQLGISAKSVNTRLDIVKLKIMVPSRAEALAWAVANGILEASG